MEVKIRPLEPEDAYISVKWRNDPEVFKYTANTYGHTIVIEDELNWIKQAIEKTRLKSDYRCAIVADGVYVGNIYLTDVSNGKADYHIFIGNKDYWGKGVAKKASQLIIEYGFFHLGLSEIKLEVHRRNIAAIKLYQSLGFQFVGSECVKADFLEMRIVASPIYTHTS